MAGREGEGECGGEGVEETDWEFEGLGIRIFLPKLTRSFLSRKGQTGRWLVQRDRIIIKCGGGGERGGNSRH